MTSLKYKTGFTIVEIMVAIIIIGILMAVSYLGFNAWRDSIAKTEVNSDLNGVYGAMESQRNWNKTYPELAVGTIFDGSEQTKSIFKQSENVTLAYAHGDEESYCIDAISKVRSNVLMSLQVTKGNKVLKQESCTSDN